MERIVIEIDKDLKQKIKVYCAMNNLTIKDFMINTIIEKMNKEVK